MSASYYIDRDDHISHIELSDVESIAAYLITSQQEEGELAVRNPPGIKIAFNVKTGEVRTAVEKIKGITIYYSTPAFQALIKPIVDAISLFAKVDLLMQLHELHDPQISAIIMKDHFDPKTEQIANIKQAEVEKTLLHIQHTFRPKLFHLLFKQDTNSQIHKAVYEALNSFGIQNILCKNHVEQIMCKVKEKNLQLKPNHTSPKSPSAK